MGSIVAANHGHPTKYVRVQHADIWELALIRILHKWVRSSPAEYLRYFLITFMAHHKDPVYCRGGLVH